MGAETGRGRSTAGARVRAGIRRALSAATPAAVDTAVAKSPAERWRREGESTGLKLSRRPFDREVGVAGVALVHSRLVGRRLEGDCSGEVGMSCLRLQPGELCQSLYDAR